MHRLHRIVIIVIIATAASLIHAAAHAGGCEDWRLGPLENSQANNGSNGAVHALHSWDPDGAGPQFAKLVAGGVFTQIQGTAARNLAARDAVTGQWQPFVNASSSPFVDVRAMTSYANQLVVGSGTTWNNGMMVGRWTGNGWQSLDSTCSIPFGASPDWIRSMTVHNNQLIAGGSFTQWSDIPCHGQYGWGLFSWDNTSTWQANFSDYIPGDVLSVLSYNGELIMGYQWAATYLPDYIAAWNGTQWQALGVSNGTNGIVRALAVFNGQLIAGGDFTQIGGVACNGIARWNGTTWSPLGTGIIGNGVNALTVYNGELIAAGNFTSVGGTPANRIARWNGSFWQSLGTGIDNTIDALTVHNGELIAGGDFSLAGGQTANDIARWNGTQWSSFGGGSAGSVLAFAPFGSRIVAGGDFHQSTANGQTAHYLSAFDGVSLLSFGSGMNGPVRALASFVYAGANGDRELVAAGSFTNAGGIAVSNIARWAEDPLAGFPPPAWEAMGAGFNNMVTALTRYNGSTVASGYFSQSGATAVNGIARWNETTDTWGAMGSGMNGPVTALKAYNSSVSNLRIVAGGLFSTAGGVAASNVAAWNENTQFPGTPAWTAMGTGFNGHVYALEFHGGSLYAAGAFTQAGGTVVNRIARWDTALNPDAWVPVGSGFNGVVSVLRSSNGFLYAGGDFTTASGLPAKRLARWNGSTWEETQGGADDDVFALQSYHNEMHTGGWFGTVRNNAITTKSWARYFETGVPWIAYQPANSYVTCNQHAYFSAVPAVGYGGLSFEWRKNGVPLANGPTGTGSHILNRGPLLDILYPSQADEGVYELVLSSDGCGSVTTTSATLDVIQACLPCPADVTHDRLVNVDDLLTLINGWGLCPPPPGPYLYYPPCTADVTGNLVVNVDDLLALINGWGACP